VKAPPPELPLEFGGVERFKRGVPGETRWENPARAFCLPMICNSRCAGLRKNPRFTLAAVLSSGRSGMLEPSTAIFKRDLQRGWLLRFLTRIKDAWVTPSAISGTLTRRGQSEGDEGFFRGGCLAIPILRDYLEAEPRLSTRALFANCEIDCRLRLRRQTTAIFAAKLRHARTTFELYGGWPSADSGRGPL